MKNKVKILLFLYACSLSCAGVAQSFGIEEILQGCMNHNGEKIFLITDKSPEITNIYLTSYGDITATVNNDTVTVKAKNANAYGTGYFRAFGNYVLDTTSDCVKMGCRSSTGTIVKESSTIVQSFSHTELIKGPDFISKGKEYAFTIKPFLANDYFRWAYPNYLTLLYCTPDSSSMTFLIDQNAQFGPNDTISVIAGQCLSNTSISKKLRPGTEIPNVIHDSLTCTDSIYFSFTIENPKENYKYWWKISVPAWNMKTKKGEITDIWVITDSVVQSGTVTLYVSNGVDTASREFMIVKKMTKSIRLVGDTACITRGEGLEYFMYPSQDVEVNWYLPTGWADDKLNPHSSSVYLGVGENAASGYIVVYTAICNEMLDSVVVSVKSLYSENKGIHPFDREETACFVIGEEALFYIEADPTVESYKWVFPEEWGIEDSLITNPFDTVVNVIIGNTTGVITVTGVACDITWERSYEISRFSPVLPKSIILDGKSCVNKGLADTVTLIATGSKEVSSFIWNYPSMWTVLESFDSTIRLLTNKDVKGEYQVALEVENQCERSSDIVSIIISQNGIGLPLTFTYALGPPVNTRVIMTVNPSNNNLYDYKWYIYSDFDTVKSSNFSYPVSKQDTATNTYCVTVTDNATGCSSMECTKPIIADIDTISRDSITVEITQPETVSRSKSNNDSEETLMDLAEYSFSDLAENNNEEEVIEESKNEFYFENTDNFIVSPNPARDHINILLEKDADYIEILNINGMTVYRKKCISRNFELSVNNLQSGLYIVKVTFNGIVKTKKLQVVK